MCGQGQEHMQEDETVWQGNVVQSAACILPAVAERRPHVVYARCRCSKAQGRQEDVRMCLSGTMSNVVTVGINMSVAKPGA